jgi:hypothetical protein
MTDTVAARLNKALPELRGGTPASPEARRALREAAASDDAALRPQLRALAGAIRSDANRPRIYDVLHGLWRLGEGADTFLANAERHAENKWLAYYSILILGREPTDAAVRARLEEIAGETTDNQIRGAIAEYGRSRYLRRRYARFAKLASEVGFILEHFRGYWNPVFFAAGPDPSALAPEAAWLERELRALSQEDPEEVARLICEADVSDLCPTPEARSDWCQHMAGLLAPEAGEALRAMDAARRGRGEGQ